MTLGPSARALVKLAVVLLVVGCLAGAWEILASQAAHSPWHAGVPAEPVAQLRSTGIALALLLAVGAWILPWAAPHEDPAYLVAVIYVGTLLTVGAMLYGAATGTTGVRIDAPGIGARALFAARVTGQGILMLGLLDFTWRILRR
jgi:hypothetical protein